MKTYKQKQLRMESIINLSNSTNQSRKHSNNPKERKKQSNWTGELYQSFYKVPLDHNQPSAQFPNIIVESLHNSCGLFINHSFFIYHSHQPRQILGAPSLKGGHQHHHNFTHIQPTLLFILYSRYDHFISSPIHQILVAAPQWKQQIGSLQALACGWEGRMRRRRKRRRRDCQWGHERKRSQRGEWGRRRTLGEEWWCGGREAGKEERRIKGGDWAVQRGWGKEEAAARTLRAGEQLLKKQRFPHQREGFSQVRLLG